MKKTSLTLIIALTLTSSAWAQATIEEPADDYKKVECSSDKLFEDNICDACYTDSLEMNAANEITDAVIPWEYKSEGDLSEIIYDNEQVYPEIKSTLAVVTKPEKAEELWENDKTLVWEQFEEHKESVITKGQTVGLYRLKAGSTLNIATGKTGDQVLLMTPLAYHEFNAEISEESAAKKRNICVLGTVTTTSTTTAPSTDTVTTPEITTTSTDTTIEETVIPKTEDTISVDVPTLNAASEEPKVIPVKEATQVETGPGVWIALLLAFVMASGWQAYQKQKSV